MITLLDAAKDSERTYRESLISTYNQSMTVIAASIEKYVKNPLLPFDVITNAPFIHENPILRDTKGSLDGNHHTFEAAGQFFLKTTEIQEFYQQGYSSSYYKLPNLTERHLATIENEYLQYQNSCYNGEYAPAYANLPDYAAHLYMPSVVKLLYDNYDFLVQKSMSIFNKPEEELFFSAAMFIVDEHEKGENIHQDYSYYVADQQRPEIETSLIAFHTAIANYGSSRLHLFPGTHKEILHTLNILKYLIENNIYIDADLAMYSACLADYVLNLDALPYGNPEVFLWSHLVRYPQMIYILDKYKNIDIVAHKVNTLPGECILFDPAILHSNGASSGNIDELLASFDREIFQNNVARLSLVIRVMHTRNSADHLLWMSAQEKTKTFQAFFDDKCQKNNQAKFSLNKNVPILHTVLSNNKRSAPDFPYLSVNEVYNAHAQSGGYNFSE